MSERQQRQRRQRAQQHAAATQQTMRAADYIQPSLLMAASHQEERFQAFHRAHPEVYRAFRQRALALYVRGIRHWGAAAIFEVLRYESAVSGQPDEPWRLNNSYRSRYARLFIAEHSDDPILRQFFSTRELRSA